MMSVSILEILKYLLLLFFIGRQGAVRSMKRIITYCYFFIIFTIVTLLELVPDHRVGYTDYDLLLFWGLFHLIFFCHGIVLRLLTKPKKIYYPLILTFLFSLVSSFLSTISNFTFLLSETNSRLSEIILRAYCYTTITFVGMLFILVVEWIVGGVKSINQFYRQQNKQSMTEF